MSKRVFMRAGLAPMRQDVSKDVRTFQPSDADAVGELMYRAYLGTVDYAGETPAEAADEVRKTIRGAYGEFLPNCSKVVERAGSLLSATLITRLEDHPFVAFSFTDPEYRNQGLARACLHAAMLELLAMGERDLGLVVTCANTPAVKLYAGMGFTVVP